MDDILNKIITKSSEQTEKLGEKFARNLHAKDVVFLTGDLGSGKTTFVKGLARGLGIETRIISPTFVIVREHSVNILKLGKSKKSNIEKLYHLDLYRLKEEGEARAVDIKDFLDDKKGVVAIEWPAVAQDIIDKKVWKVVFRTMENNMREITIRKE